MTSQINLVEQDCSKSTFESSLFPFDLEGLKGKRIIFRNNYSKDCIPLQSLRDPSSTSLAPPLLQFSDKPAQRDVVAVDSSCVLIGETESGAIYAGRVAFVQARNSKISTYSRFGPILFYLEPNSKPAFKGITRKAIDLMLLDRTIAERFIRIRLERWLQFDIARKLRSGVLLVDGGLRSSILEDREFALRGIEERAADNSNEVLGISKATNLRILSALSSHLDDSPYSSAFIDVSGPVRAMIPNLKCRVLVVRFLRNSTVFRVDSSDLNSGDDSQILADLKFNDILYRGYPETLRLAHHLSVFDISTVNSIRVYLSKKYELTAVPNDDLRATVLGRLV